MTCPNQEVLQAFLAGQFSDQEIGDLARHLVDCERCIQTLAGLKVHDPLLDMVHSLTGGDLATDDNQEVDAVVARVCGLRTATLFNDSRTTPHDCDTDVDGSAPESAWPSIPGYEILGFLDGGGMGKVYKARHVA